MKDVHTQCNTTTQQPAHLVLVDCLNVGLKVSNVSLALLPQIIEGNVQSTVQLRLEVRLVHTGHGQRELATQTGKFLQWVYIYMYVYHLTNITRQIRTPHTV